RATRQVLFNKDLRAPVYNGPEVEAGGSIPVVSDWKDEAVLCDLPNWGSAPPIAVSFAPTEEEGGSEEENSDEEYVEPPNSPHTPEPQ
ncbi:hypothetical protein QBC32DRAFT_178374, partial [Pseudoneurospora amorphoporcata]